MFRESDEVTKAPGKKGDPTTTARSSIRRQRSVRYPTYTHRDRPSSPYPQSHHHGRPLVDALRVRDRARVHSSRPNSDRGLNIEIAADQAHAEASRQRRLESGRAILRDALSYEHTQQSITMGIDDPYPSSLIRPPTPSLNSFRRPLRGSRHRPVVPDVGRGGPLSWPRAELTRSPPPAYIPSPPYTSPGHSNSSSPETHTAASLTPRFAPAHVQAQLEALEQPHVRQREPSHEVATASDQMSDDFPPLYRISRRRNQERGSSIHGELDGLGDRWRSVSPDTDPWEILLSTMPPDDRLPSTASSSFRSNEDFASHEGLGGLAESMGNGMNSYQVICDNSDSDFTDAEQNATADIPVLADGSSAHVQVRTRDNSSTLSLGNRQVGRTLRPYTTGQSQAFSTDAQSAQIRRLQRHLDEVAMLTSNDRTSNGHPSRERL